MRIVPVCALLFVSTVATASPRAATVAPLTAQVTLSAHLDASGQPAIEARYHLSRPVTTLAFSREASGLREKMWVLDTRGIAFNKDRVVSTDRRAFRDFRLHVLPYTEFVNLNYAPAVMFSDHSLALFTGYFNIAGTGATTEFRVGDSDVPVLVYGQPASGRFRRNSFPNDGSFIYFGKLRPIRTPNSILVLDPDLPAWIKQSLIKDVPDILSFYARNYGSKLERRTFILFNWNERHAQGKTDYKGDSLDDNIAFTVSGANWSKPDLDTRQALARLIAHELAHQWNAHLFVPSDFFNGNGGNWLPEGQAEFSANQTGYHFGWLSRQQLLENYTADINNCLLAPANKPISQQNWDNNAIYGCGVTFNLLAQAALQQARPQHSFFDLWHAIYNDAAHNKHQYSVADYLQEFQHLSGNTALSSTINTVVTKSAANKTALIVSALQRLKFGFVRVSDNNADIDSGRQAASQLFWAIMQSDCHGSVSFYTLRDGFRVDPVKGCQVLTKPYVVKAIQGQPLFEKGFVAYRAVLNACAAHLPVELVVAGQSAPVKLQCPATLPPMPEIIRLTSLPWLPAASVNRQSATSQH